MYAERCRLINYHAKINDKISSKTLINGDKLVKCRRKETAVKRRIHVKNTHSYTRHSRRCDQTATNDSATVTVKMIYSGRPQIQPGQFPADFCEISRTLFKQKYSIFVRDKPYNIRMQVEVCNVDKWACVDELRPTLIIVPSNPITRGPPIFSVLADSYRAKMLTTEIIVILFSRGLPYVQCAKNAWRAETTC